MVKTDLRTKKDIQEILCKRAASYTPEWNMDLLRPDIAAALAIACAEMFEGTVKKINGLPLKNEIAFYNLINACLRPASPSEGYVSFHLSTDDAEPVEVPKGTVLTSFSGDDEPIHFETLDDVLVSSSKIVKSFCIDDSSDHIGQYEDIVNEMTRLFSLPEENLQSHTLTLSHPYAFHISSKGEMRLSFFHQGGVPVLSDAVRALADSSVADIEYYTPKQGYVPIKNIQYKNGELVLIKSEKMPPIEMDEDGNVFRFTVKDLSSLRDLSFSYMNVKPSGSLVAPDSITDGITELEINSFFPFGERFQIFNEIYIGCNEVLDKRGAAVNISFDMNIIQVPIENQLDDDGIKWKWIANKSDFKERTAYKITITQVIWEYYNGYGWSRLFPDDSYSDIFHYNEGVTSSFKTMSFVCPEDMSQVFVGAKEDYYIRARVLKADNLYKLKGFYMSPLIRNLSFDYHYDNDGCRIEQMNAVNCLEEISYSERDEASGKEFIPFYSTGDSGRTVYLGFSSPLENGPLCTLWDIAEDPLAVKPELFWEYYSDRGWKHLNLVDETNGFTTVGLTIFLDNHGFMRKKLFGEELYWVRITDVKGTYRADASACPVIRNISLNSVMTRNVDSHREDRFAMNVYTEDREFSLSASGILDISVYVNEYLTIFDEEVLALEKEGRIRKVTDSSGMVTELWVRWDEVNTFITEGPRSRSYTVDRSKGTIKFGNGRKGRIPSASDEDNIIVYYTTGGGARTNVSADAVSGMERSIGLVSAVSNPKSFYGGSDTETVFEALKRSSVMLRTQGRAITSRDFEELALCSSNCIEKVRCFSGRSLTGSVERGAVTLVVLKSPDCDFSILRNEIKSYMLPRMSGALSNEDSFFVTEPSFIRMNIKTELVARSLDSIFELKRTVDRCIREHISSYSGTKGNNEWMLGRIPNEHQIRSAMLRIENIDYIKSIKITTYVYASGGLKEIDSEGISELAYILPVCGDNDISITLR